MKVSAIDLFCGVGGLTQGGRDRSQELSDAL